MADKSENTITNIEQSIAWLIAGNERVSGIFNGAQVPVYCTSDEDFAQKLNADIQGGLGQTIRVAYSGREKVQFQQPGVLIETGRVNVIVSSSLMMANSKPESAIAIADAIDEILTGTVFDYPFTPMPLIVNSSNYELNEERMRYEATLSVRVQFFIKHKNIS